MHVSTIFLNFTIGLVVHVSNLGFYCQLVFLYQEKNDNDAELSRPQINAYQWTISSLWTLANPVLEIRIELIKAMNLLPIFFPFKSNLCDF
jgi:hypothetical protein